MIKRQGGKKIIIKKRRSVGFTAVNEVTGDGQKPATSYTAVDHLLILGIFPFLSRIRHFVGVFFPPSNSCKKYKSSRYCKRVTLEKVLKISLISRFPHVQRPSQAKKREQKWKFSDKYIMLFFFYSFPGFRFYIQTFFFFLLHLI